MPEYERLLKSHPDDPRLVRSLVDVLLNIGDHPRAKARLAKAIERFPDRVDFALSLALLEAVDGDTAKAEQLVRQFIEGRPLTSERMRLDAASLYVQLRRTKLAGPIIAELLKSHPDDAKVLTLSVRYALLAGDHATAARQLDKLERLYPGNVELRLELASDLYAARRWAEAGRMFGAVLNEIPGTRPPCSARPAWRYADYRVNRADAFLQEVPEDVRGRQWYLVTVERDTITGNYLRAHQILHRLLAENPDDERASMALGDLDRAENDFLKADCRYWANGAGGDDAAADGHLALSLLLQDRYCEAEQVARDRASHRPRGQRYDDRAGPRTRQAVRGRRGGRL